MSGVKLSDTHMSDTLKLTLTGIVLTTVEYGTLDCISVSTTTDQSYYVPCFYSCISRQKTLFLDTRLKTVVLLWILDNTRRDALHRSPCCLVLKTNKTVYTSLKRRETSRLHSATWWKNEPSNVDVFSFCTVQCCRICPWLPDLLVLLLAKQRLVMVLLKTYLHRAQSCRWDVVLDDSSKHPLSVVSYVFSLPTWRVYVLPCLNTTY